MDSISVEGNIEDVNTDTTHILISHRTFLGSPLEGSDTRILNFVQVLNTLGDINEQVGTSGIGTEAPDLPSISDIPTELVSEDTSTELEIITRGDLAVLDGDCELLVKRLSLGVETIVFVLRFRESDNRRLSLDGLTVTDDRV